MYTALDRTRFGYVLRALLAVFALVAMLSTAAPHGAMALEDDSIDAASTLTREHLRAGESLEAGLAQDGMPGLAGQVFPHAVQTPDSLLHPAGIAVDDGKVYVVASGNDRIDIYTTLGTYLESWGDSGSGPGQFIFHDADDDWNYGDIAIDEDGNFYVADPGNNRVQIFDVNRDFVRAIGDPGYPMPSELINMVGYQDVTMIPAGLAIDDVNDKLYIADAGSDTVKSYSLDGLALDEWGMFGSDTVPFGDLFDIAVANDGSLWAADFSRSGVFHLSPEGEQLAILGTHGLGAGQFMGAAGVAIDGSGTVYVTDYLEGEVQVIGADGKFVGVLDGDYGTPTYVAVDNNGELWVSYEDNNEVVNWHLSPPPAISYLTMDPSTHSGSGGK